VRLRTIAQYVPFTGVPTRSSGNVDPEDQACSLAGAHRRLNVGEPLVASGETELGLARVGCMSFHGRVDDLALKGAAASQFTSEAGR
jgi:hypothetical protein